MFHSFVTFFIKKGKQKSSHRARQAMRYISFLSDPLSGYGRPAGIVVQSSGKHRSLKFIRKSAIILCRIAEKSLNWKQKTGKLRREERKKPFSDDRFLIILFLL